ELIQFTEYAKKLNNPNPTKLLTAIREGNHRDTFPNVDIALRIYLCNFATNCSGERSFSTLSRVKNELRSNMSQERMSALSLLCIESDVVRNLSFDDVIDDFAGMK